MKRKPSLTILFIGQDQMVRADVPAGARDIYLETFPHDVRDSLAQSAERALSPVKASARKVLVLDQGLGSYLIELPRAQVSGLSREQMRDALSYEIEAFSDMPPAAAEIAFQEAGGDKDNSRYRVVQAARSDLAELREVLTQKKLRLLGLAHPGALPVPLTADFYGKAWRRTERWSGREIVVSSDAQGKNLMVSNALHPAEAGFCPHVEFLGDCAQEISPSGEEKKYLLDGEGLPKWLMAWARLALRSPERLPLIASALPAYKAHTQILTGVACLLLLSLGCGLHWMHTTKQRDALREERMALRTISRDIGNVERKNGEMQQTMASLRKTLEEQKEAREKQSRCREAFSKALEVFASGAPKGLMLLGLASPAPWTLNIEGIAHSAELVDGTMVWMTQHLRDMGWQLASAEKTSRGKVFEAGPLRFTLCLELKDLAAQPVSLHPSIPYADEEL